MYCVSLRLDLTHFKFLGLFPGVEQVSMDRRVFWVRDERNSGDVH